MKEIGKINLTNRERFVKLFNGEELDRCPGENAMRTRLHI